jgi:hypothetical protein
MATDDRPQPKDQLPEATLPSLRPREPDAPSASADAEQPSTPVENPVTLRREAPPAALAASPPSSDGLDRSAVKVGLLGGRRTGKSYLFQSIVYRTGYGGHAGALTYYTNGLPVTCATHDKKDPVWRSLNAPVLIDAYRRWLRLNPTTVTAETWYRLSVPYYTGWSGRKRRDLRVVFFDGSGEQLAGAVPDFDVWKEAFLDAAVMVFCLPLWVAFPALAAGNGVRGASRQLIVERDQHLLEFAAVIQNFRDLREKFGKERHPIRTVLALTMADDRRGGLDPVRHEWIEPYVDAPLRHLDEVATGQGIVRYLAAARQVSEFLHGCFRAADDRIGGIPAQLREFDAGEPWIIPVSAIDGARLETFLSLPDDDPERSVQDPVPAHVELPLLLALCESANALM